MAILVVASAMPARESGRIITTAFGTGRPFWSMISVEIFAAFAWLQAAKKEAAQRLWTKLLMPEKVRENGYPKLCRTTNRRWNARRLRRCRQRLPIACVDRVQRLH